MEELASGVQSVRVKQ